MLVQFVAENFLSFATEQVLNLAPVDNDGAPLRCAALYGPNAAGKSNLVRALSVAQEIVAGIGRDVRLPFSPFRSPGARRPTRFQFHLFLAGEVFEYGFTFDEHVKQEWLARLGGEEILFERSDAKSGPKVELSPSLTRKSGKHGDFLRFVAEGTRRNQLFLAECGDRNVRDFQRILHWFHKGLVVVPPGAWSRGLFLRVDKDAKFRNFLSDILRDAGTGVHEVFTERHPLDIAEVTRSEPAFGPLISRWHSSGESVSTPLFDIERKGNRTDAVIPRTRHRLGGRDVPFFLYEESDGTQRLLHLAGLLYDGGVDKGRTVVVDELERSLHPLLTRSLVKAFRDDKHALNSQLLFTTHDTNLLDQQLLPLDAVWFVERNEDGGSRLFPLTDFNAEQLERIGPDLERGYLAGRFGAVPPRKPVAFGKAPRASGGRR